MNFDNLFTLTAYSSGFTFLCTTLGAAIVFLLIKKHTQSLMQIALGFSAGIMLAASIFSLIIPALDASGYEGAYRLIPVIGGFLIGIGFLITIDKTMPHLHMNADIPEGPKSTLGKHSLMFIAITIHNIPEGMAIGVSAAASMASDNIFTSTLILALGIGIQNIPEGAAVSMPMYADGISKIKSFLLGTLSGAVEPIAALLVVLFAKSVAPYLSWVLSFAAGAMMYVVIEELIPQSHDLGHSDKATISILFGFILMMALDVSLG